jgi:hypothetical protein
VIIHPNVLNPIDGGPIGLLGIRYLLGLDRPLNDHPVNRYAVRAF